MVRRDLLVMTWRPSSERQYHEKSRRRCVADRGKSCFQVPKMGMSLMYWVLQLEVYISGQWYQPPWEHGRNGEFQPILTRSTESQWFEKHWIIGIQRKPQKLEHSVSGDNRWDQEMIPLGFLLKSASSSKACLPCKPTIYVFFEGSYLASFHLSFNPLYNPKWELLLFLLNRWGNWLWKF